MKSKKLLYGIILTAIILSIHINLKINFPAKAAGNIIYVDDDNTDGPWDGTPAYPYMNITSGLANALDGDTVQVQNGTYNENIVVNKSITLKGESKPVINASSGTGIYINVTEDFAYGVTVDGFEILSTSSYGIQLDMEHIDNLINTTINIGNIIIANNTIASNQDGIYVYVYDIGNYMYGNSTLTIGYFRIADNVINSDLAGINIGNFGYIGYEMHDYSSFSMGNIEITNNTVTSNWEGILIEDISELGCYMYEESNFMMGSIAVNDNTIDSYSYGILLDYFEYFGNYMEDNSSFTIGNIEFNNNTINSDNEGIYIYEFYELGYSMYDNSQFVMGNVLLNDNVINSNTTGIWFGWGEIGYLGTDMYGNSSFAMGNVEFCRNIINSLYDGMYIDAFYEYGYAMNNNSTFTMGSILVNDNVINSGEEGIYVYECDYFGEYLYDNSSFTMGDIEFCRNMVNATDSGIYIYEFYAFGDVMEDDSSFTMGDIRVNNNAIYSGSYGIRVDYISYFGGSDMYDTASFVMGDIEFSGNEIVSGDDGIYIDEIAYFGNYMYGNSTFTMGSILVNDNTISSGNYGIFAYDMHYFGMEIYGNSSVTMNNIEFCRNTINSTADAIGFSSFRDFGTYMYGDSSFSMGNILVSDNILQSYIWLTRFGFFGAYLYENSSCTMGNTEFCRNVIYSNIADGISFYDLRPFGVEMHNYTLFRMGDFSVNNNIIASNGSRSGIYCNEWFGGFGINIYDSAAVITGSFEFGGNDISSTWCGLSLVTVNDSIAKNNIIWNSMYGIYLASSAGNHIYHNNFINNTVQAYVTTNYNNTWDNGYPSGGNYWSDYHGTDQYKGSDQNIPGSDFIGDTPYEINSNNTDHYPLMIPYETESPVISILSPENTTYAVNTGIALTFTVSEPPSWMGYSLNGQTNVTISGNTTLSTLLDGWHYVTVYADDNFGNMGSSTVYFTVDTTPPNITSITQTPLPNNVLPENKVRVNATITDATSGIKQAMLNYTWTNSTGTYSQIVNMTYLEWNIWNATIPAFTYGTNVTYTITVEDNAGNTVNSENLGYENKYQVVPEFSALILLPLFMITTLIALLLYRRKRFIFS